MMTHRLSVTLLAFLLLALTANASISSPAPFLATRKHELVERRGGAASATKKKVAAKTNRKPNEELNVIGTGTATIPNEIVNLVKSIVGAGVLGLSSGIAAFANSPRALLPACFVVMFVGSMSGYCFSLIGRVCAYTGASSYGEAWSKSVSPRTAFLPAVACLLVTCCAVLAYSMILSDTIPQLFQAFLGVTLSRTNALLGVTIFCILPLCLLKNLSSLSPFSLVGTVGMVYTAIAMGVRYLEGSYKLPDGKFLQYIDTKPSFGDEASIWNPNVFVLLSMLSSALMAHYNAPKFYFELKNNTLERYNAVVACSFAISIVLFVAFASLGFLTFGAASDGLVLNNYATQDGLMSISRLAVAASIVFGYPLAFVGVRDGVLDLFKVKNRSDSVLNKATVILLAVVTVLAFFVKNLRSVLSLGGATWGNAIIYLFPTFMVFKLSNSVPSLKKERPLVIATGLTGLCMGIIGTLQAVKTMQSS